MALSEKNKIRMTVLGSELIAAPIATIGAVYCSEKFFPHQMKALKCFFAERIVEPHLPFFEKLSTGLNKAHDAYDERKRAALIARGETVPEDKPQSKQERAYDIADVLVRASVALAADYPATLLSQSLFKKVFGLGQKVNPFKTTSVEAAVHLGGIALLPTLFAGFSENVHHGLSKMLQKVTGIDKKSADNIAFPATYITAPGLVASLVSLKYTQHKAGGVSR